MNRLIYITLTIFSTTLVAQTNVSNYLRYAQSLEKNEKYEEALDMYQKVHEQNSKNIKAISGIVRVFKSLQEYDQIIDFLNEVIQYDNIKHPWYIDLGEAYYLKDNRDMALRMWNKQIVTNKKNPTTYRLVANAMIRNRLYDEALEVYKRALENIPNQFYFHLDIANLSRAISNSAEATLHFLLYMQKIPKQNSYIERNLISLLKKAEDSTPVIKTIEDFKKQHPEDAKLNELLASVYINEKFFDKAYLLYLELDKKSPDKNYLQIFAEKALRNDAFDQALNAYNHILNNKENINANEIDYKRGITFYQYGKFLKNSDDFTEADKKMNQAVNIFMDLIEKHNFNWKDKCYIKLGDIHFDIYFDLDEAISSYKNGLELTRDNKLKNEILVRLGDVYLTMGNKKTAVQYYSQIYNKNFAAIREYKTALVSYFQNDFDRAVKNLSSMLSRYGLNDSLSNNSLALINFINSNIADSSNLSIFARADFLKLQKKYSEATKIYKSLIKPDVKLGAEAGRKTAHLLNKLNESNEAITVLSEIIEIYPNDIHIDKSKFLLARLYQQTENFKNAFDLYQNIITQYPTSLYFEESRIRARELNLEIINKNISG